MSQTSASSLEQSMTYANLRAQEQQLISHVRQLLYDEQLAPQVRAAGRSEDKNGAPGRAILVF